MLCLGGRSCRSQGWAVNIRVWGLGVWGLGVWGLGVLGLGVWGLGFRDMNPRYIEDHTSTMHLFLVLGSAMGRATLLCAYLSEAAQSFDPTSLPNTIGTFIIRIGLGGILYHNINKEPPE